MKRMPQDLDKRHRIDHDVSGKVMLEAGIPKQ